MKTQLVTMDEVKTFVDLFTEDWRYTHIYLEQVDARKVQNFLSRDYIRECSIERMFDFCADWCMANQLCNVQA